MLLPRRFFHLDLSQFETPIPISLARFLALRIIQTYQPVIAEKLRERLDGRAVGKSCWHFTDPSQIASRRRTYVEDCPVSLYPWQKQGIEKLRSGSREMPKIPAYTGACADCDLRSQIAPRTNNWMDALRDRDAWTYRPSWQERVTDAH